MEPESKPNPGYKVDPEPGFNPESKNASEPKPSSDFFFSKRNPSAAVYSEKVRTVHSNTLQYTIYCTGLPTKDETVKTT